MSALSTSAAGGEPRAGSGRQRILALLGSLALLLATFALAGPVFAATIVVNSTDDDGTVDGDCNLREAIQAANTDLAVDTCLAGTGDADIINVPAGTYELSLDLAELVISESVSIVGLGATRADTVIDGQNDDRVFEIGAGTASITNLTITEGLADDIDGGGIFVGAGAGLNLTNVVVTDNAATDAGGGGGIFVSGTATSTVTGSVVSFNNAAGSGGGGIYVNDGGAMTLTGSVVNDNGTETWGGGIYNDGADLDVLNTTIRGNRADIDGGGIYNDGGALSLLNVTVEDNHAVSGGGIHLQDDESSTPTITIDRSTINANTATEDVKGGGGHGGGIWSNLDFSIVNSTVSGNSADNEGGGIRVFADLAIDFSTVTLNSGAEGGGIWVIGNLEMFADIIANQASGADCFNADANLTSLGSNIDSDDTCDLDPALNDKPDVDPLLGLLADNGGPTMTHALLTGSPAIDAVVTGATTPCFATDQRGIVRPQDGDNNGSLLCDIGAYELLSVAAPTPTPTPTMAPTSPGVASPSPTARALPDTSSERTDAPAPGVIALVALGLLGVSVLALRSRRGRGTRPG